MNRKNPWQTTGTREVYKNAWIRLREDSVIRPDGNPGIYSVVEARPATGVLAVDHQDRIVLVGQYRYPTERYSWEIPEGGAELGESPLEAIKRELREEAGLEAAEWSVLAENIQLSNCYTNELGYLFLAKLLTKVSANPDATEELVVRWVTRSELERMLDQQEITDALTVLAVCLYLRRLQGRF